jgi:schlafen family protein
MLLAELAKIDEAHLLSVCAEHRSESQTLDFKRDLPGTDDKSKREFLKDVCAFANADGGDLVYGLQEKPAGHADHLAPIPAATHGIDSTKLRLAQILQTGLEPPLAGVVMQPVPLASGDYVLVVRVPGSFQRPHRYRTGAHTRWVVRVDTGTVDLTYEQIRDAFDRGATLAERARRFRDERLSGVVSGTNGRPLRTGPRCVVHLIPLAAVAGRLAIDVGPLYHNGYQEFMFDDWGGATRDFNLDGLVIYPGRHGVDIAYSQLFRAGAFEAARWVGTLTAQDEQDKTAIASGVVSGFVRAALLKFFAAAARWNVSGPAIAATALLDLHGWHFRHFPQSGWIVRQLADRPNLMIPEVWVDQVGAVENPDATVIRPLLDTLWQAFGLERCMFYDAQGNWAMH